MTAADRVSTDVLPTHALTASMWDETRTLTSEFYANPGHAEGDMLACLCPLTLRNWLSLATKALLRRRRQRRY